MSFRPLSMSSGRSRHASLIRRPAPYTAIDTTAGTWLADIAASRSLSTSARPRTSGFFCGTFGHGIFSAMSGRSSVTPWRNLRPAECILSFSRPAPWRTSCPR